MAESAVQKGRKAMIVCNRKELIKQSYDKLVDYGLTPTILAPGYPNLRSSTYVSSVDTLLRHGHYPEVDFVIIDECHIAKFDRLVDVYLQRGSWVLGATATPLRKGQQRSLHTMYTELVSTLQIKELISDGFLSPNVVYGSKVDLTALQTKNLEYNEKKLFDFYNRQTMYDGVFEHWQQFSQPGPTIVYNVNVEASKIFTIEAKSRSIPCAHIDGTTPDYQRAKIFRDFEKGLTMLSNCQLATTGYDFAGIKNVIANFATKSLTKWLQVNGRGGRIDRDKHHFVTIDMGSNTNQHGFWEDDRQWQLKKRNFNRAKQAAPVKNCPNCEAMLASSATFCEHCGYQYTKKERELIAAEFVRLERGKMPSHLRKPIGKMDYHELLEYARFKGYKPGWAWYKINQR